MVGSNGLVEMRLKEIISVLEGDEIYVWDFVERNISMVCASDLMSDVLSPIKRNTLLLTGLVNPQVVRTAEFTDIVAVCFVRGKKPQKETVELAKEKQIPLIATRYTMFEACGKLYMKGLYGCDGCQ